MNSAPTVPELLAPAGSVESGIVALDCGADAVYAGLPRFNARERGENLSFEDLGKLVAYAHRGNRKVYVTLNTLVKERELRDVAEMLVELAMLGPDAVIVQDLGVVRLVRERFPCLTIHASTQMGIHNSAGVNVAERMGVRRVILQRQVTFDEIRLMRERTDMELEVFVHGALCCGRSGGCLFSSWMGGWSGNRGRCKQPCRRRYHSPDGNGFFFSPGDLYSLEAIPELCRLGVTSLKIEGRLRRADYVEHVVSAYRSVLDAAPESVGAVVREGKRTLADSLGRKWVRPFAHGDRFDDAIDHQSLGTSGRIVGRVVESGREGFAIDVGRGFEVGDVLRVQPQTGDEGPVVVTTRLSIDRRRITHAPRGSRCWVHFDKPVPAGGVVFKIGNSQRSLSQRVAELPFGKPAVDLQVTLSEGGVVVHVRPLELSWEHTLALQPARSRPLTGDALASEFSRSADSVFAAAGVSADVRGDWFVPASEVKRVRRAFWAWLDAQVTVEELRAAWDQRVRDLDALRYLPRRLGPSETVVLVKGGAENPVSESVTAAPLGDFHAGASECVLPDFCREDELVTMREKIQALFQTGVRRFRVTSLHGLDLVDSLAGIDVTASFPLPVCNALALSELVTLGVVKATAWVELEAETIGDLLARGSAAVEVFQYGRLPILSTRFKVPVSGRITDGRGGVFFVGESDGLTRLYPERAFCIDPPPESSTFIDLSAAEFGEPSTSRFNYDRTLV